MNAQKLRQPFGTKLQLIWALYRIIQKDLIRRNNEKELLEFYLHTFFLTTCFNYSEFQVPDITSFEYSADGIVLSLTWQDPLDEVISGLELDCIEIEIDKKTFQVDLGVEQYILDDLSLDDFPFFGNQATCSISVYAVDIHGFRSPGIHVDYQILYPFFEDEYEDNNVQSNAKIIDFSKENYLNLYPENDEDWFHLSCDENTVYEIISSGRGYYDADVSMEIYDFDENIIRTIGSGWLTGLDRFDSKIKQEVFLRVFPIKDNWYGYNKDGDYIIDIRSNRVIQDIYESNDTISDATNIDLNNYYYSTLHSSSDVDYYKFNAIEGNQYYLRTISSWEGEQIYVMSSMSLYTLTGSSGFISCGPKEFYWSAPETETYTIKVEENGGNNHLNIGDYELIVHEGNFINAICEPNNDITEAYSLIVDNEYKQSIHEYTDVDWFSFYAESGRRYMIETRNYFNGTTCSDIVVLNTNGDSEIETDIIYYRNNGGTGIYFRCSNSGTYYFTVTMSNETMIGNYYVRVQQYDSIFKDENDWIHR